MPVKWYGEQVKIRVKEIVAKRIIAAAIELKNHIREKVSVIHPSIWDKRRKQKRGAKWQS